MKIGSRKHQTHSFAQTPEVKQPRSQFDLSHGYKTAFNSGDIVPFFVDMAYPGDTFNIRANCFARLSTPIVPFMDNLYLDTFWFAVPIRLIWLNFKKMMGEQVNPADSISYTIPRSQSPASGFTVGSLYDYMGVPPVGQIGGGAQIYVNNLAPRAYNLIWNEWFRDENLQNSITVDTGDGPDTYSNYVVQKRGKRKDYFTSGLPWPQKGTAVTMPLSGTAPVLGIGADTNVWGGGTVTVYGNPGTETYTNSKVIDNAAVDSRFHVEERGTTGFHNIRADLSQATSATINQFRQAIQVQSLLERDARCGTRYTEIIQGHFGVISPDSRLQRPEYLGGGSTPIKINPVVQTSNTPTSGTPQGNLAAYGIVGSPSQGFVKSFTEHCIILGLVNVRADLNYQQGLSRFWTDQTRYDLFWPALAHLGEQAILNQEIYCDGSGNDTGVFAYAERYGHFRYKQNQITGLMRSTSATTLDVWHLAQKFTGLPTLGSTFITENPPIARVVAVNTEPQFIFDSWISFKAARPMPVYGIPATLGRF